MEINNYKKSRYRAVAALTYSEDRDEAPYVSLREEGASADYIVSLAKKYNIPIVERPLLVRSLLCLEEGTSIPSELFKAVAVLFHEVEKLLRPL